MENLKPPTRYPDLADPQARPRYTGIASFFRTPLGAALAETDIGLIGVPFDGGVTNRSGARHGPRAVREQSALLRRINAATGVTPFASARVRDLGDCWLEQPYALEGALEEIAGVLPDGGGGRRGAAVGGRRPLDQPADPARGGRRRGRSAWCISTRIATPATTTWARASTTVRRSAARWRRGCWTPRGSSRSASAAPSTIRTCGGSARGQRHAGAADGRVRRPRLALRGGGGAAGGGRRPDLPVVRHRQPGPVAGAGHRHPGSRRHHRAGGAAAAARAARDRFRRRRPGGGVAAVRRGRADGVQRRLACCSRSCACWWRPGSGGEPRGAETAGRRPLAFGGQARLYARALRRRSGSAAPGKGPRR